MDGCYCFLDWRVDYKVNSIVKHIYLASKKISATASPGATVFWIGEWIIKQMPFVKHTYSASKQLMPQFLWFFVFFDVVFGTSWIGATVFWIGEWIVKRMPFVMLIYSDSKQFIAAISAHGCYRSLDWIVDCKRMPFVKHIYLAYRQISVAISPEWIIKRMPFVKHIYSASKQISAAISPVFLSHHGWVLLFSGLESGL
ncbi:unnamed protein product [Ilex paraguariensis]|uniref:Uncharacterized protein n=1 Tax=Ilex paraguariensis TaxID=185542 RepID=A0ABC8TCC1_9AQUA